MAPEELPQWRQDVLQRLRSPESRVVPVRQGSGPEHQAVGGENHLMGAMGAGGTKGWSTS